MIMTRAAAPPTAPIAAIVATGRPPVRWFSFGDSVVAGAVVRTVTVVTGDEGELGFEVTELESSSSSSIVMLSQELEDIKEYSPAHT